MANEHMSLSKAGYAALRRREGTRLHYYNDKKVNGNCTWGVGTLAHFGPCTPEELRQKVTAKDVNRELAVRVHEKERIVRRLIRHHQLTQAQFDAAVSFAYNSNTINTRRALAPADRGDMITVVQRMMQNVYITPHDAYGRRAGTPEYSRGLHNRRIEETQPFRNSMVTGVPQ